MFMRYKDGSEDIHFNVNIIRGKRSSYLGSDMVETRGGKVGRDPADFRLQLLGVRVLGGGHRGHQAGGKSGGKRPGIRFRSFCCSQVK